MKGDTFWTGAAALTTVCAIAMAGLAARQTFWPRAVVPSRPPHVSDWKRYSEAGHRIGPKASSVTIVNFSDFQCPFCRRMVAILDTVQARDPNDVSIVDRHFPLGAAHPKAFSAALATECANDQGQYAVLRNALYLHQDSLNVWGIGRMAAAAGIGDTARLMACVASGTYRARVRADMAAGERLGIVGTPTLLINDYRIDGVISLESMDSLIAVERRRIGTADGTR